MRINSEALTPSASAKPLMALYMGSSMATSMLKIFFSDMVSPQNKKAVTAKATAKALARGTKRDARERVDVARISGSLFEIGNLGFKVECLREAKLQVHAIGARDAMLAPLRYVLGCATKQRSNECVATDPV